MRTLFERNVYGRLMLLIGLLLIVPLLIVPFYPDEVDYALAFFIPGMLTVFLSIVICLLSPKKKEAEMEWKSLMQRGSFPVLFIWCFAFIVGALPFYLGQQLSFFHSLYESTSGWTTTGLSMVEVEQAPYIFLFYRSFMQFCGGLGFILVISMLIHEKQYMNLYEVEGHPDRLRPTFKKTARIIFTLYSSFLVGGTLALKIAGMNLFESLNHTMAALSTGGFSTRTDSIGAYQSLPITIITILLMLVGSVNFAIILLMVKGQFKKIWRITEIKFLFAVLFIFVSLITFSLVRQSNMAIGESFWAALFGVMTASSTAGFSTVDYAGWPPFASGLIIVLMMIGGGAGSTSGAIKRTRIYFLMNAAWRNMREHLSPSHHISTPTYHTVQGKRTIEDSFVKDAIAFIFFYIVILTAGTLAMMYISEWSLFDALFEFASSLGTVGISNGLTGVETEVGTLIVQMIGMVLGRLEIFIVFVGIYSGIRRLNLNKRKRTM